jgi:hypothetical protein
MKAVGIALAIVGYALLYSGASNLFTGGQGWGFLQSLLNKGEANQSGKLGNSAGGSSGKSGGSSGGSSGGAPGLDAPVLGGLEKLFQGLGSLIP